MNRISPSKIQSISRLCEDSTSSDPLFYICFWRPRKKQCLWWYLVFASYLPPVSTVKLWELPHVFGAHYDVVVLFHISQQWNRLEQTNHWIQFRTQINLHLLRMNFQTLTNSKKLDDLTILFSCQWSKRFWELRCTFTTFLHLLWCENGGERIEFRW